MVVAGLSHCNENHRAMITLHCVPHNKKITQFISPPVLLLKKKLFIIAPRAAAALRLSEREITQRRRMSTAELCAFGSSDTDHAEARGCGSAIYAFRLAKSYNMVHIGWMRLRSVDAPQGDQSITQISSSHTHSHLIADSARSA